MADKTSDSRTRGPWSFIAPYRSRLVLSSLMLLATAALALSIPKLLGQTVEALQEPNASDLVPPLAMWMIVIACCQAATRITSRVLLFNAARLGEYDLRSLIFRHLLTLDVHYYRDNTTGDVMSRITNDVQTVRAMWGPGLLNIVNTSFLFTVALILMLRVDPTLTAWAMVPYPLMVIIGLAFGKRIYRTSRAVQEQLGQLSSSLQEDLGGVAIIKSYNLENNRYDNFAESSQRLLRKNMNLTKVRGQLVPVLGAVAALGTVAVLFIGGRRVIQGHLSLGQLIEFNAYLAALVWPTLALGWMISLLQRGRASWERIDAILQTVPSIQDGDNPIAVAELKGHLQFAKLCVSIGDSDILHEIELECRPGTTTAIVGRTGSGKSTLISALPRMNEVPKGQVFLDGIDINELPLLTLRSAIGFAPQEAFLFSTTIANNIRFGVEQRADGPTSEEQIAEAIASAARDAGLTRDLEALPDGLETIVGERGITLSGGQRQRVALARALATKPKVLVLDDSLSSVDAQTEQEILGRLAILMADRTSILISHRLAAVRSADQIAVLEEGKLVELGTHEELLERKGVYSEIYQSQLKKGLIDE